MLEYALLMGEIRRSNRRGPGYGYIKKRNEMLEAGIFHCDMGHEGAQSFVPQCGMKEDESGALHRQLIEILGTCA